VSLAESQYGLAIYHLMTHACFKALLFLSAGAVIHAVWDVQDIRRHGGMRALMPLTYTAMIIGSLSLAGLPFLSGFYSKDAILEASWSHPTSYGTFAYLTLMAVAALTSFYTFRLRWCSFISPISSRKIELPHPGLPLTISLPLIIRSIASLRIGYLLSDALIGAGTSFWNGSIFSAPATTERYAEHCMPSSVLVLPILATFTGILRSMGWSWPMPWVVTPILKWVYLFFLTRWQFDFISNSLVCSRVLNLGADTWALIDKGVLELLGPRGRTHWTLDVVAPQMREWQTGIVHDYARIRKIAILAGFLLILLPGGMTITPNWFSVFDPRTGVAVLLWIRSMA